MPTVDRHDNDINQFARVNMVDRPILIGNSAQY
jgi:hypothetical protein